MIKVKIFRDLTGMVTGFNVTGHADTAPHGQDIVCAAVSALTQTALLGLGKHLKRELDFDIASGKLKVSLKTAPDELTSAIFETMILGLTEIENINPKGVHILEYRR
ncbi:MAG: hypothetical protein K0Q53_1131 [Massilibacillus sp.]|jgi:uncharacterized protein|nr:hypothetical protein [Massilibacillus sp.]